MALVGAQEMKTDVRNQKSELRSEGEGGHRPPPQLRRDEDLSPMAHKSAVGRLCGKAFLKHDLEGSSSHRSFQIHLPTHGIASCAVTFTKYQVERASRSGGGGLAFIVHTQAALEIGCESDVKSAVQGALEEIDTEW